MKTNIKYECQVGSILYILTTYRLGICILLLCIKYAMKI